MPSPPSTTSSTPTLPTTSAYWPRSADAVVPALTDVPLPSTYVRVHATELVPTPTDLVAAP